MSYLLFFNSSIHKFVLPNSNNNLWLTLVKWVSISKNENKNMPYLHQRIPCNVPYTNKKRESLGFCLRRMLSSCKKITWIQVWWHLERINFHELNVPKWATKYDTELIGSSSVNELRSSKIIQKYTLPTALNILF